MPLVSAQHLSKVGSAPVTQSMKAITFSASLAPSAASSGSSAASPFGGVLAASPSGGVLGMGLTVGPAVVPTEGLSVETSAPEGMGAAVLMSVPEEEGDLEAVLTLVPEEEGD